MREEAAEEGLLLVTTKDQKEKKKPRVRAKWLLIKQLQFILDMAILIGAFVLSYLLRFDFAIPKEEIHNVLFQLPYIVLIEFTVLILTGTYAFIWRYTGISEAKAFLNATLWSILPILILRLSLPAGYQVLRVPLSVMTMDAILSLGGLLGVRIARRLLYERSVKQLKPVGGSNGKRKRVLMVGAGRAGQMAVKEIIGRGDMDLEVKGFVDDDPNKKGAMIHGVKVLGTTQDLPTLITRHGIDHVIISIAQASRQDFRRILDMCEQIPVKMRVIPSLAEILQGKVRVSRIRDVQIEDLLGREAVRLDEEAMRRFLSGKTVMVSGAGGSIGSELARQVMRFEPGGLLLVERAEFALFNIERELREASPELPITSLIADVGDEVRMRSIFTLHRPQVVLHAAAHKHVPMMEFNPCEAIKNNVLATRLIGELAGEFEVEVFVLISTDKAVRPTSVMGASKRVAELVIQDLDRLFATRYVAVRFGNVIGSAGSVIPIFRDQICKGGPVKVTHPSMMRYFMTIPEAAQLVLQAGTMGKGGEIFILDMGEPVSILDLAKDTITLSGLKPFEDIDIVFTGLRPGEKLFEELETNGEQIAKTRHPKIFIGKIATYPAEKVREALIQLTILSMNEEVDELRKFLNGFLPEARLKALEEPSEAPREKRFANRAEAAEAPL